MTTTLERVRHGWSQAKDPSNPLGVLGLTTMHTLMYGELVPEGEGTSTHGVGASEPLLGRMSKHVLLQLPGHTEHVDHRDCSRRELRNTATTMEVFLTQCQCADSPLSTIGHFADKGLGKGAMDIEHVSIQGIGGVKDLVASLMLAWE